MVLKVRLKLLSGSLRLSHVIVSTINHWLLLYRRLIWTLILHNRWCLLSQIIKQILVFLEVSTMTTLPLPPFNRLVSVARLIHTLQDLNAILHLHVVGIRHVLVEVLLFLRDGT